jgi:hypothetical protein
MSRPARPSNTPLQNRVTPFGEIIAEPERGTLMGNRGGCFHRADKTLAGRRWVSRRWIACVLQFRGRHRAVMTPGRYTELFFLDEATALAAGHRPCRECRRDDHERFKDAWMRGNPTAGLAPGDSIDALDAVLHRERVRPDCSKVTYRARLGGLPDGVFVAPDDDPRTAFLVLGRHLLRWSPGGYTGRLRNAAAEVAVLTPRSTVRAIAHGYAPGLHSSASSDSAP